MQQHQSVHPERRLSASQCGGLLRPAGDPERGGDGGGRSSEGKHRPAYP